MTHEEYGFDMDTGKPKIGTLATAIQVWSIANDPATIEQAMNVFKTDAASILEACEWHPYLYVFGPSDDFSKMIIEHEGE